MTTYKKVHLQRKKKNKEGDSLGSSKKEILKLPINQLTKPTNRGREQRKEGEKKKSDNLNRTKNIQDVAVSDTLATK